jgi:hypothetical protein
MVSVLATVHKGCGFKPSQDDGFLRAIKIRSTTFFGWKVKPEVTCHKILRHVKGPLTQNSHSFVYSSYSLPYISAGRIYRELWWTSQEFFPAGIIITMVSTLTYHTGNEQ